MKKIYVVLILVLSGLFSFGQGIEFFHGPYDEVLKKAKKENKRIFIDVYTSWCGPCKMMAKDVFADEAVGKYYNQHFVCLKLDAEKEKDYPFFAKYQAGGYPSLFWLDGNGKLIDMYVGYMESGAFIEKGRQLKDSQQAEIWETYRKRWEKGERSVELMDKYVFGYLARAEPDKTKDCCLDYLKSLSEEQLKTEHTYRILLGFNRGPQEDGMTVDYQLKYWNDYKNYDDYMTFNTQHYRWIVRNANIAAATSPEALQKHVDLFKGKDFPQKEMYLAIIDAETTLVNNVPEGIKRLNAVARKYGKAEPWLYTHFAYSITHAGYFVSSDTDAERLADVRYITERAYELFPSQETAVYLAATYLKEGNIKEAYATLGVVPFLDKPMLSSALYGKVGLKRNPQTEYRGNPECKELQDQLKKVVAKKKLARS